MRIGVPREIKNHEYRVGLTPAAVRELTHHNHQVFVEHNAALSIGFTNEDYERSGAIVEPDPGRIFELADLIVKVKEPLENERLLLKPQHTVFTYLHLAADLKQTKALQNSGTTCIAYETVTDENDKLPLLAPMSEVAGRMSIQAGAMCLENPHGGSGVLLGGVAGVPPGQVVILGGGVVGQNAAQMAVGLGARVTVIDKSLSILKMIDRHFGNRVQTLYSTQEAIHKSLLEADLLIGAVLVPGAVTPKLVSAQWVKEMKPGSVIVDVAIDQGGCIATSHPTTHTAPTYVVDDVVHYCVANMPGAVARTSTTALNNATLPFVLALANRGIIPALKSNAHLRQGLNVFRGQVTNESVSEAHDITYADPWKLLDNEKID